MLAPTHPAGSNVSSRERDPDLSGGLEPTMTQRIATHLIEEAHRAKAERLVVACPQCKRTSLSGAEALESTMNVVDIAELVLEAVSAKQ